MLHPTATIIIKIQLIMIPAIAPPLIPLLVFVLEELELVLVLTLTLKLAIAPPEGIITTNISL